MTIPLLEINSLSFSYKVNLPPVFNNLSLKIEQGELTDVLLEEMEPGRPLFLTLSGAESVIMKGPSSEIFSGGELVSLPQVINLSGTLRNEEVLDLICCFNKLTKNRHGQSLIINGMIIFHSL